MTHETPGTFADVRLRPKDVTSMMAQLRRSFHHDPDCFIAPIIYA